MCSNREEEVSPWPFWALVMMCSVLKGPKTVFLFYRKPFLKFHASCTQTLSWVDSVPFFMKFCLPLTNKRYRKLFNKKLRWWHFVINHAAPTVSKLLSTGVYCIGFCVYIYALLLSLWSHSDWLKATKEACKLEWKLFRWEILPCKFKWKRKREKHLLGHIRKGKRETGGVLVVLVRKGDVYFCRYHLSRSFISSF